MNRKQKIGSYYYEDIKYDIIWHMTSYEIIGNDISIQFKHSWDMLDYFEEMGIDEVNYKDKDGF
ncbi:MAG: hypothetical protein ACRC42_01615 [Mycoplasma sp.]